MILMLCWYLDIIHAGKFNTKLGRSLLASLCFLLVPLFAPSEISSSFKLLRKSMTGGFDILFNLDLRSQNMDLAYKECIHCHMFVQERFDLK